jgi:hypothetical protein
VGVAWALAWVDLHHSWVGVEAHPYRVAHPEAAEAEVGFQEWALG